LTKVMEHEEVLAFSSPEKGGEMTLVSTAA
jgi:hypothetical protein